MTSKKDKTHMIISINVEKAFHKIQHLFMIKTFNKLCIDGPYFSVTKGISDKHKANTILNGERVASFSSNIRNETGCPLSLVLPNTVLVLAKAFRW